MKSQQRSAKEIIIFTNRRHSKQHIQFNICIPNLHLLGRRKEKEKRGRRCRVIQGILEERAVNVLPLSPYCSQKVQDLSCAENDNQLLRSCGTTRLLSLAGKGLGARTPAHVLLRDSGTAGCGCSWSCSSHRKPGIM